MKVTNAILKDLVHCSYKAFNGLKRDSNPGEPEILTIFKKLKESHFKRVMEAKSMASISFNITLENERFYLTFDGIERKSKANQIGIMTVPFERVTKADKVFLALKSHFAEKEFSIKISHCKIIYGVELNTVYFKISSFKRHISKLAKGLEELNKNSSAPTFYKNNHCTLCRFHSECSEVLRERDDLSLLAGMKPNEIANKNNRGIFTVRQLSFLFKVKKNPYRNRGYRPELKALAIRENKTYILEDCNIPKSPVQVFLDIEGLPERNFHYLIGLIIRTNNQLTSYSLWADNATDQKKIFGDMLTILSRYENITIYHYGSYDNKVLAAFFKLYPEYHDVFERTIASKTFNILSILAEYVYSPTYSNGLKEIAKFIQFQWTDDSANGLQSMVWRYNWEDTKDEKLKQKILQYNIDDCRALMKVFDWLCSSVESNRNDNILSPPKSVNFYKWGITDYAITEYKSINEKAYFNYQRNHIALRNRRIRSRNKLQAAAQPRLNKPTRRVSFLPLTCPNCKRTDLIFKRSKKIQIDLLLMKTGIKSLVTVYEGGPFRCSRCGFTSKGTDMRRFPRYGRNLMIWAVNQKIQYNLSSLSVINFLKDTVKISVSPTQMTRFKEVIAVAYKRTYEEIRERMINSTLIHVDETIARIKGIDGYVWVFANHDCVYYEFRRTRETAFLKTLLASFKGTLVSDFYSGYDSIACDQQKCLIHLIRDINSDFLRNQFDQDFKFFVTELGSLLKKIISTIDKFGLKEFHLHKHCDDVNKFYRKVIDKATESEINLNYQRRFKKYREKLFRFLTADNIPWNNNNAEHSIKPFAKWRKLKSTSLSVVNIENHLILLSILQTCKYKGISFFEFIKSGEQSIFKISEHKAPKYI